MKISNIISGINGARIEGEDCDIDSLVYNTQDLKNGENSPLFFCIEGFKTDGHIYAQKAAQNGAAAVVVSKNVNIDKDITKVWVKDTREAMALMAANFYNRPSEAMKLIGITGTNGKTTSTFMLKSIIDSNGEKTGLLGTIYNIIGDKKEEAKRTTPESLDLQRIFGEMRSSGVNSCIMEVSSHSLELKRVHGVDFKVGIFTNLTQDHLDFHGTMENYFNAKMLLFKNCETSVINVDDEFGQRAINLLNNRVITYGIDNKADIMAKDISISGEGTNFILVYKNEEIKMSLHLPGKFNVYNALGCAGAAIALNIPLDVIKRGLESLESVPGRSEKINSKKGFTVVIDYAHTPDGIVNILNTAREYTKGRLIALFGCGGDRDKTKRPKMGMAAGSIADYCIVTSDNPRTENPDEIINDILPGINQTKCPYDIIVDRMEAIKSALKMAQGGDVVVIAGKGHETYQVLKDKTIHFDEKEIVLDLLREEE